MFGCPVPYCRGYSAMTGFTGNPLRGLFVVALRPFSQFGLRI